MATSVRLPTGSAGRPTGNLRALPSGYASDVELVVALVEGRPNGVAALYDRYAALVRRVLSRTLGSIDIDDACQDTFLVIIKRIGTLKDPAALRSFVIGIAIRVSLNELRKRKLRRFVGLSEGDGGAPAFEAAITGPTDPVVVEQLRAVYRILDGLDAEARTLFVLRRIEQLELTELADAMGCSLSTAKRKLYRAERRFASMAERYPALRDLGGAP